MLDDVSTVEETPIQVTLEVPNHGCLVELLETISNTDLPVQTETITQPALSAETSVTIDLDVLTEKQREALELALDRGYYDRPRDTDLDGLAANLEISKSAVSQRLRTAETKIIENALDRYR